MPPLSSGPTDSSICPRLLDAARGRFVAGHASGLQRRGIFLRDGATTTMPVAVHAALATGLTLDEPSTRSFYQISVQPSHSGWQLARMVAPARTRMVAAVARRSGA